MDQNLVTLLYKKDMSEKLMETFAKGVTLHSELIKEIKMKLESKKLSKLERVKLQIELNENEWKARQFSERFKLTRRDYQHYVIPQVDKIATDEEKQTIEFINHQKEAEKLAEYEMFGKAVKLPANIEHPFVIKNLEEQIENVYSFIDQARIVLNEGGLTFYESSKLKIELFDKELQLKTLIKRLNSRNEYYMEQFLPVYKVELAEAKEKVEAYYKRGNLIAKTGIDVQLQFILDKYSEHVNDEEKLWLYYTSLKNRVNGIIEEIKKDKVQLKELQYLTEPI